MYQSLLPLHLQETLQIKTLIENWRNQKNPACLISSESNILSVPIKSSHGNLDLICVPKIHRILLQDITTQFSQDSKYYLTAHSSAEKESEMSYLEIISYRRTENVSMIKNVLSFADTLLLPVRFCPSKSFIHFQLCHVSKGMIAECSVDLCGLSDVPSNSFFPLNLSPISSSPDFSFSESSLFVSLFFLNWSPSIHMDDRQAESFEGSSLILSKNAKRNRQSIALRGYSRKSIFGLSSVISPQNITPDSSLSKKMRNLILVHIDVLDKETRKVVGIVSVNAFGCGQLSRDEYVMKLLSSSSSLSTADVNPSFLFHMRSKSKVSHGELSNYFTFSSAQSGIPLSLPPVGSKGGSKLFKRFTIDQHGTMCAFSSTKGFIVVVDNSTNQMMCASEPEEDTTPYYFSIVPHDSSNLDLLNTSSKSASLSVPNVSRSYSKSPTCQSPLPPSTSLFIDVNSPKLLFFSSIPEMENTLWENGKLVSGPPSSLLLSILCHPDQESFETEMVIFVETYLLYSTTTELLQTLTKVINTMKETSDDFDGFSRRLALFCGKLLDFQMYLSSLNDAQTLSRQYITELTALLDFISDVILSSSFLGGSEKEKISATCQKFQSSLSNSSFDRFQVILQKSYSFGDNEVFDPVFLSPATSRAIAYDLTIHFHSIYSHIRPTELYGLAWCKHPEKSPHITNLIDLFNIASKWFVMEILKESSLPSRVVSIEAAISVMGYLRKLRNYYGTLMVYSALSHSSIGRLKLSWEKIQKKRLKEMGRCEELFSSEFNWKVYRDTLTQASPPAIPNLSLYLQDVTFIEEGNQNFVGPNLDSLNFYKMRLWSTVLKSLRTYQESPYELGEMTTTLIKHLKRIELKSEEECYALSLLHEPRQSLSTDQKLSKDTLKSPQGVPNFLLIGGQSMKMKKDRVKASKLTNLMVQTAKIEREVSERKPSPVIESPDGENLCLEGTTKVSSEQGSKRRAKRRTSLPSYKFAEIRRKNTDDSSDTLSSTSSSSSSNASPVFGKLFPKTSRPDVTTPLSPRNQLDSAKGSVTFTENFSLTKDFVSNSPQSSFNVIPLPFSLPMDSLASYSNPLIQESVGESKIDS